MLSLYINDKKKRDLSAYLCCVLESVHGGMLHVLATGSLGGLHEVAQGAGDVLHGVDQHHLEDKHCCSRGLKFHLTTYLSFLV